MAPRDDKRLLPQFGIGEVLVGKYRVEREIGRGGMGVVLQAWHLELDEMVAIKAMLPEVVASEEAVGRFEREARALFKLRSPHVCRVLDVARLADGTPLMVMELLAGEDMATYLHRRGPLPVHEAVCYALQACDALSEAHARGIVHRDLKPENVFVCEGSDGVPMVKLVDFGLSKVSAEGKRTRQLTAEE
jgi:serine/threonine protein kinase